MSRRRFLVRMNAAAAGAVLAGPLTRSVFAGGHRSAGASRVALARVGNYDRAIIRSAVEAMFSSLGGLGDIVRPGDHVGIKINLTGGHGSATSFFNETGGMHPGATYWTHPEVLRAVGELILDAGAGRITVVEAIYDQESYFNWGYSSVVSTLGANFVDLNEVAPYAGYAVRPVGNDAFIYDDFTQNGILNDLDSMVSLAKSKRHNGAGVTHGMKNLVGTLPLPSGLYNNGQGYRAAIHELRDFEGNTSSNLCRVILDLNHATPIQLVVNDAVQTVLGGEGPWGPVPLTPVSFDTLVASKDPVAADAVATQYIGWDPLSADSTHPFPDGLNYLRLAQDLGMGTADPGQIDVSVAYSTGVDSEQPARSSPELAVFPNPFSERAVIEVSLPAASWAALDVVDIEGRRVRRLLSESVPSGRTRIEWDGRTDRGKAAAGVYVARLTVGGKSIHRKLVKTSSS